MPKDTYLHKTQVVLCMCICALVAQHLRCVQVRPISRGRVAFCHRESESYRTGSWCCLEKSLLWAGISCSIYRKCSSVGKPFVGYDINYRSYAFFDE